jgi:hypothetical protein
MEKKINEIVKISDTETITILEEIEIKEIKENWTDIELANGVKIRIKIVVFSVASTDKVDEKGRTLYAVKSQNVIDTNYPEV